jgi:hypothetical protein
VQYHIDSYVIPGAGPLRKSFGDVDFMNFGVSTPSLTISLRAHHIEALGPCLRPRRFTYADDTGRQAEL